MYETNKIGDGKEPEQGRENNIPEDIAIRLPALGLFKGFRVFASLTLPLER